jgi:curved DNA-binding protein CbpA
MAAASVTAQEDKLKSSHVEEESIKKATHYEVLKIAPDASFSDIKAAYHTAARLLHPDRSNNNSNIASLILLFCRVQAAWECLGNESQRQAYDMELRLQEVRATARKTSAIVIVPTDCRLCRPGKGR